MPRLVFTPHLDRHIDAAPRRVDGPTLADALRNGLDEQARRYILDDQGALRKHIAVFIDGAAARDRQRLTDPLDNDAEVYIMQALSGG